MRNCVLFGLFFAFASQVLGSQDSLRERIAANPNDWASHRALCRLLMANNDSNMLKATRRYQRLLTQARDSKALGHWYQASVYLAGTYGRQALFDSATITYQSLADSAAQRNHPQVEGKAWYNLGVTYVNRGFTELAADAMSKALKAYQQTGKESDLISPLALRAAVQGQSQRPKEAIETLKNALTVIRRADPANRQRSELYRMLANSMHEAGYVDRTVDYFDSALVAAHSKPDSLRALTDLAGVLAAQGNHTDGLYRLNEALALARGLEDEQAPIYHFLGLCNQGLGRYEEAEAAYRRSLAQLEKHNDPEQELNSLKGLLSLLREQNRHKEAWPIQDKIDSLAKGLNEQIVSRLQLENEARFDLREREWEIGRLEEVNIANQALLEAKSKRNQLLTLVLALAATLVLVLAFTLWQARRNRRMVEQKNRELQVLNQTKDSLFRVVSHDMKNLMSGISLSAEKLMAGMDTNSPAKAALTGNMSRATDLLEKLTLWGKAQLSSGALEKRPLYLADLMRDVFSALESDFSAKGNQFFLECDDNLKIKANKVALEAIFRNLLQNANKFTKQGRVSLSISQRAKQIEAILEDNGVGMDGEQLNRVNNALSHSKNGTAGEKGHGLGLMIVRDYLQHHQASLHIDSTPGQGSRFRLIFPQ